MVADRRYTGKGKPWTDEDLKAAGYPTERRHYLVQWPVYLIGLLHGAIALLFLQHFA